MEYNNTITSVIQSSTREDGAKACIAHDNNNTERIMLDKTKQYKTG